MITIILQMNSTNLSKQKTKKSFIIQWNNSKIETKIVITNLYLIQMRKVPLIWVISKSLNRTGRLKILLVLTKNHIRDCQPHIAQTMINLLDFQRVDKEGLIQFRPTIILKPKNFRIRTNKHFQIRTNKHFQRTKFIASKMILKGHQLKKIRKKKLNIREIR